MEKYLNRYLDYLKYQKNYSINTINSYEKDINKFILFLKQEHLDGFNLEHAYIKNYLQFLNKNLTNASICRHISSLKSFYKYLFKNKLIKNNPFNLVSLPRKDKKLPKYLHSNELDEIFNVFDLTKSLDVRNRLIFELLYATGIRVGELVQIKLQDINLKDRTINIWGKGNKERIANYGEYAEEILNMYLNKARPQILGNKESIYLFINKNGTGLTDRGVRYIVDETLKKTSIKTKMTPHTLRHTFATHLLNEGCDILIVQELLGHESLRATQIYTHITNDALKETYLKTHPRKKDKIK